MGLSGPRKRVKLSHDPNNTAWSRSTTKYGQKILESQGWTPGDFLGAKNAPHATHYTAANASHIRIALKDDNLGLGAKPGRSQEDGQTTGLDMFQDILGRLNGKSESQLEMEQKSRSQMKRSMFVEQRWGSLRFVDGGFLVGDKLQESPKEDSLETKNTPPQLLGNLALSKSKKHQKTQLDVSKRKKAKSKESRGYEVEDAGSTGLVSITVQLGAPEEQPSKQKPEMTTSSICADDNPDELDEARRRAEKAERKLKRKMRREKKHPPEADNPTALPVPGLFKPQPSGSGEKSKALPSASKDNPPSRTKVLQGLGGGRNAVRQRYIQHKRMSMMDSKALKEASP
ncbi:hypothetical protein OEA41_004377 [Lepraria neglecta]|uniref:PinX1-related protein 1 n=1 Tax=Lepraria neglecta TaxID=209136 RepID=A0AAD9YZ02_9LECA|nr:hypothetical protein OEA41_004377 [Lepraria neglecta]